MALFIRNVMVCHGYTSWFSIFDEFTFTTCLTGVKKAENIDKHRVIICANVFFFYIINICINKYDGFVYKTFAADVKGREPRPVTLVQLEGYL